MENQKKIKECTHMKLKPSISFGATDTIQTDHFTQI